MNVLTVVNHNWY